MDPNLIIDDDYIQEVGRLSLKRAKELDEILASYIEVLREIESEAITSGKTAQAISAYVGCVSLLTDRLSTSSEMIKKVASSFIIDVNVADEYLF